MLNFLSTANAVNPDAGFIQPGDLTWWIRQNSVFNPSGSIELFHADNERLLGFVFSDPLTWAVVQAMPSSPAALLDEMLTFAQGRAGKDVASFIVWTFEGDTALTAALVRKGYTRSNTKTV